MSTTLIRLVATIASSYLRRNTVAASEIPALIRGVHEALSAAAAGAARGAAESRAEPAVSPGEAVHRDHVVCLSCGFRAKTLRRHLRTAHGLTVDAYRRLWDLPSSFPMTAPEYAARRSRIAKATGLGAGKPPSSRGSG